MQWLPGAIRVTPSKPGFAFDPNPKRVVIHTTESHGTVQNPVGFHAGLPWPYHIVVYLPSHRHNPRTITQAIPLDKAAYALKSGKPHGETNRAGALQICIDGDAKDMRNLSNEDLDWLVEAVLRPIMSAWGVKNTWATFRDTLNNTSPPIATEASPNRMSWGQWNQFNGVCGHQHAPSNDHWDPGALHASYLAARLGGAPSQPGFVVIGLGRNNDPEEVKRLQRSFQELGLYKGEIDGIWGPKSNHASFWWKANRLGIKDGNGDWTREAEERTKAWSAFMEALKKQAEQQPDPTWPLKVGDSGANVAKLAEVMDALDANNFTKAGDSYTAELAEAVKAWQQFRGRPITGNWTEADAQDLFLWILEFNRNLGG